ncbi:MAG: hypothetical protein IKN74_00285 [Clostridia bacterium]|nr:hypothetical protein [Clostridia bacterium]
MRNKNIENKEHARKVVSKKNIIQILVMVVAVVLVNFVFQYFFCTPVSFRAWGFWLEIVVSLGVMAVCGWIFRESNSYDGNHDQIDFEYFPIVLGIAVVVILILSGIFAWIGSPMFNATTYSNQIEVVDGDFQQDIPEINTENLIIVDQMTAQRLGDRTIGGIPNATYYEVDDEYNLIEVNGDYYRISPLNFGGLFKANKAKSIPGYVLVNAETQSATYKELDTPMTYSPSAYWSHDLERHIHFAHPSYILGKSYFEIDDEGKAYWITEVKSPSIFIFGGSMVNSVVITDACNGEMVEYAINNLPDWVDHAMSVSYLMDKIQNHYVYSGGFGNALFAKQNVYKTAYSYRDARTDEDESKYTPFNGYNSVVAKDGTIWFYTGITPASNSETNYGFVLISPSTGEARFYPASGAEESSAQKAAEGKDQSQKYSASFPTIFNVDGEMTYFMLLKDNAGLVQRYALCNVAEYQKTVQGETLNSTLDLYRKRLAGLTTSSVAVDEPEQEKNVIPDGVEIQEMEHAIVTEVTTATIDGTTYFYFRTEDALAALYVSSIENSSWQTMLLIPGNMVTFKYYDSNEQYVHIVTEIVFK